MTSQASLFLAIPVLALASVPFQEPRRDYGKALVERPIEKALIEKTAFELPGSRTVAPGLVRWHADFDAARAAASISGKPVLLFQLLGRLDEEFC